MAVILKKDEKVTAVVEALQAGFSVDDFVTKFKNMHPKDWERIQKSYRDHERKTKPGKTHPMPAPEQYLKNCLNTRSKSKV